MWRKQDEPKASSPSLDMGASHGQPPARGSEPAPPAITPGGSVSKGIQISGEITGREDLVIDGEVHGSVRIPDGSVTVGVNGRVQADLDAREIIVRGKVEGGLNGSERVVIGRSGDVVGDIATRRIAIEEGAFFCGKITVARQETAARPAGSGADTLRPIPIRAQEA